MTIHDGAGDGGARWIIEAFPMPGDLVEGAYDDLDFKRTYAEDVQRADKGSRLLPRPWDPPSCVLPELREQVWDWLERVVVWVNHEYAWDTAGMIPACWVQHPHLVHEVAVLADRRRRAALALTSADLEEFHRSVLPDFITRMHTRLRSHCEDREHQPWPSRGRHVRHCGEEASHARQRAYAADVRWLREEQAAAQDDPKSFVPRVVPKDPDGAGPGADRGWR